MARYALAASLVLSTALPTVHAAHADADAWSYLPVTVPTPLSDMSVVSLTSGGGGGENNATGAAKTRIIITGGCDSPEGNEEQPGGYFECSSLTNKVRPPSAA